VNSITQDIATPSALLPPISNLDAEWRKALRSERFAWWRRRICVLRAGQRLRHSASRPSMGHAVNRVAEIIELKVREGWLGLHKKLLKARRVFK
jgi:hypothetical protein